MKRTNNTFYVSVEGDCETWYLDWLSHLINEGNFTHTVRFMKKKDNPLSFAKSTTTGYSEYPYFHICDYEGNSGDDRKKFKHILDKIKEARLVTRVGYKLAYTNLCFELWIILHKEFFSRSVVNKSSYKDKLNAVYGTNFTSLEELKKETNFKKILQNICLDDVKNAIANAKNIQATNGMNQRSIEYKGSEYYETNPSLNIYEFIELVLKKCGCM